MINITKIVITNHKESEIDTQELPFGLKLNIPFIYSTKEDIESARNMIHPIHTKAKVVIIPNTSDFFGSRLSEKPPV